MESYPAACERTGECQEVMNRTFAVLLIPDSPDWLVTCIFDAIRRATASGLTGGGWKPGKPGQVELSPRCSFPGPGHCFDTRARQAGYSTSRSLSGHLPPIQVCPIRFLWLSSARLYLATPFSIYSGLLVPIS